MKLSTRARKKLIDALADLSLFHEPQDLREFLQAALAGAPYASAFLRGFRYAGSSIVLARRVVLETEGLGTPPGDFLDRILVEVMGLALPDEQRLAVNAALERLRSPDEALPGGPEPSVGTPIPSAGAPEPSALRPKPPGRGRERPADAATPGTPEPSAGGPTPGPPAAGTSPTTDASVYTATPTTMVSFSHADRDAVAGLVKGLQDRGVHVIWDQDMDRSADIPVWVWSTFQRVDWVVIACSASYAQKVEALLRDPTRQPPTGKGVSQEARLMASEHIHYGPARFVPVLLPGAGSDQVPLVARGQLNYRLPADLDGLAQRLREPGPRRKRSAAPSADDDDSDPEASPLDRLRRRHIDAWCAAPRQRHERFVALELATTGPEAAGPRRQPQTYPSLEALLAATADPAVLLVGEPGAGKTTLLEHLRFELAEADLEAQGDRVVFLLPLNQYPRRDPPPLFEWIAQRFVRDMPGLGPLSDVLAAGRAWLLLDGLNEMAYGDSPQARFDDLGDALRNLPPGNRAVVTCRTQDVLGVWRSARAEVKPLAREAVREFLGKYLPERAEQAFADLERKRLVGLYQNPYRLSLLVDVLHSTGTVPEDRAALFSSLIALSLFHNLHHPAADRWLAPLLVDETRRCLNRGELPAATSPAQGALLQGLSTLAFEGQRAAPGEHRWWGVDRANAVLEAVAPDAAAAILNAGRAILVLEEDDVEGRVRFAHQQLQEFFAARAWVATLDEAAFAQATKGALASDPRLGPPLEQVIAGLRPGDRLPERRATGWEETALLAVGLARNDRFVDRLAEVDLVTAGRAALSTAPPGASSEARRRIRRRLAECMRDYRFELRTRIDAGLALDDPTELGFERRRSDGGVAYLWPPTRVVPAGRYVIGSGFWSRGAHAGEKPKTAHVLTAPLAVAQYPVINAEYALFMEAGGYDDARWWPEGEAQAWWRGERPDTETEFWIRALQSHSDEEWAKLAAEWGLSKEERAPIDRLRALSFEEAIAAARPGEHPALLKRPGSWTDDPYDKPLQPVVGVCVFEAEAYARWLTATSGSRAALLDERTWEACARGRRRRTWAFGDRPDPSAANTRALGLGRTSPVGVFAPTPEGLHDVSGNVWEWTSSPWRASHKATEESDESLRVVRGGSWYLPLDYARAAYRNRYPLDNRLNDQGFRLCFPAPQSEG